MAEITLETLTADVLQPLVGQAFAVTLPSGRAAAGALASVDARAPYPASTRVPFSFILRVPGTGADARQGMIRIEHAAIGALDLFAVPVGQDGDAILWQAVFS